MLDQNSEVSVKTKQKMLYINICPQTLIFWSTSSRSARRHSLKTFIFTETSNAVYPSPLTLYKCTFMPIKPLATAPKHLKVFDRP
jgi:hypothetical protein